MILKISKNVAAVAGVFALTIVYVPQTYAAQIVVKEFTVVKDTVVKPSNNPYIGPQTILTAKVTFKGEYTWSSASLGTMTVAYGDPYTTMTAQSSVNGPQGSPLPATLNANNNNFARVYYAGAYNYSTSLSVLGSNTQPQPVTGNATLAP
jgi:hypothetical protein